MAVKNADVVARNIKSFGGGFTKHVNKTMDQVLRLIDGEVVRNISSTDYSLEDLAAMGHPYAKRHGPQGIQIHDPYWQVHTQSGTLLNSKYKNTKKASITAGQLSAGAYVGVDEQTAPHVNAVIYGTSKMIPRNFLSGSLERVKVPAYKHLKENLRDMVMHFKPKDIR